MARLDVETLRKKRERLEAELQALRAKERDSEERRSAIAGRVVLDHALKDRAFAEQLMRILDTALTKRQERKLFGLPVSKASEEETAEASASGSSATAAASDAQPTPGGKA
jgi:HD superfamily phosphodiesterase